MADACHNASGRQRPTPGLPLGPGSTYGPLRGPDVPAGTYSPQVADGYYLILKPLSAGEHTIEVHVESGLGFSYDQTYNLTVQEVDGGDSDE